jgi:S-adenosylmethionine:tRNA ribosyltransferase-isomerase
MQARGIGFATITHAAGISSTGDPELDRCLPLDEPYRISETTARAIRRTRARGGRIVAVGTSVVRALEHAASQDSRVRAGDGVATQRIGAGTPLRVIDAILSGTHEPGTSHHELLRALADDHVLQRMTRELDTHGYRTHEFGDSVLIERSANLPVCCHVRPGSIRSSGTSTHSGGRHEASQMVRLAGDRRGRGQ